MSFNHPTKRRVALSLARSGTVFCALGFAFGVWNMATPWLAPVAAAPEVGAAQLVVPDGQPGAGGALTSGGSATVFQLALPLGAACSGDSLTGEYRVQSYMVPNTLSPADIVFDASGPSPSAIGTFSTFRQPLYDPTGNGFIDRLTSTATPPSVAGPVSNLGIFNFSVFSPTNVRPGTYNVGIACTTKVAAVDKYWNIELTFAAAPDDSPAKVTWTASSGGGGGTTTTTTGDGTTTTTIGDGSTTTTAGDGSTTTTAAGGSTTTVSGGSSTTAAGGGSGSTGSTTFSGGNPSSAALASTVGQLPYTGNSPWSLVVWGAMLLVFGRMAILLGRKPKVRALGE